MPPRSRNQRPPTACDAPTASAASSLVNPFAISHQNRRSTSRRSDGLPGDLIDALPVNPCIHPAGLPINTSTIKVLQRPVESAQYTSIRYTERLAEAGAQLSIGSVGDSYDNAMAESIIGLFKTELIRRKGPWRSLDSVELATLEWVDWYNNRRLFEAIGNIPPAEAEANHYRTTTPPENLQMVETSLH
jgi:hypothetical protein